MFQGMNWGPQMQSLQTPVQVPEQTQQAPEQSNFMQALTGALQNPRVQSILMSLGGAMLGGGAAPGSMRAALGQAVGGMPQELQQQDYMQEMIKSMQESQAMRRQQAMQARQQDEQRLAQQQELAKVIGGLTEGDSQFSDPKQKAFLEMVASNPLALKAFGPSLANNILSPSRQLAPKFYSIPGYGQVQQGYFDPNTRTVNPLQTLQVLTRPMAQPQGENPSPREKFDWQRSKYNEGMALKNEESQRKSEIGRLALQTLYSKASAGLLDIEDLTPQNIAIIENIIDPTPEEKEMIRTLFQGVQQAPTQQPAEQSPSMWDNLFGE